MEQIKPKVLIINTSMSHITAWIEREMKNGYVLQGAVQVVPEHHRSHWNYIATMVLKEQE